MATYNDYAYTTAALEELGVEKSNIKYMFDALMQNEELKETMMLPGGPEKWFFIYVDNKMFGTLVTEFGVKPSGEWIEDLPVEESDSIYITFAKLAPYFMH